MTTKITNCHKIYQMVINILNILAKQLRSSRPVSFNIRTVSEQQTEASMYITDKEKKDIKIGPLAGHFNQKSHTMADMLFFAFEKVQNGDPFIVGARERFYIDKMEVLERGINKNRTNK
jgi:hypothetical protein